MKFGVYALMSVCTVLLAVASGCDKSKPADSPVVQAPGMGTPDPKATPLPSGMTAAGQAALDMGKAGAGGK